MNGEIDYESVYWERLRKKLLAVRNYVPVNVICSAIGGVTAAGSLCRLEKQVLKYEADLVIVCFGLNDVNGPLDTYLNSLRTVFEKCRAAGSEVIFMTPNTFNTYVAEDTPKEYYDYASVTAGYQNGGKMDEYMERAVEVAHECGVGVCDCYGEWKRLAETEDITMLLANRINHPTREMHELFADSLFRMIMGDGTDVSGEIENTMYNKK
jgi:hypothetical protein